MYGLLSNCTYVLNVARRLAAGRSHSARLSSPAGSCEDASAQQTIQSADRANTTLIYSLPSAACTGPPSAAIFALDSSAFAALSCRSAALASVMACTSSLRSSADSKRQARSSRNSSAVFAEWCFFARSARRFCDRVGVVEIVKHKAGLLPYLDRGHAPGLAFCRRRHYQLGICAVSGSPAYALKMPSGTRAWHEDKSCVGLRSASQLTCGGKVFRRNLNEEMIM